MGAVCCCLKPNSDPMMRKSGGGRSGRYDSVRPMPSNVASQQKRNKGYSYGQEDEDEEDDEFYEDSLPSLPSKAAIRGRGHANGMRRHKRVFSDSESSGGEGILEEEMTEEELRFVRGKQQKILSKEFITERHKRAFSDSESDDIDDDEEQGNEEVSPDGHADIDVRVPPGPVGLLLSREYERSSVVEGFCALPDGSKGILERSGKVHPGSVLQAINGMTVSNLPLEQVIYLLQKTAHVERILTFRQSSFQYDDL